MRRGVNRGRVSGDPALNPGIIMDYSKIKPSTIAGIVRYVDLRCPTGSFLRAVLVNDLKEAVFAADEENLAALPAIVYYCYNEIPSDCWGSPKKVAAWLTAESERERREASEDHEQQAV